MPTLIEENEIIQAKGKAAAEEFFGRHLFRSGRFILGTALGVLALLIAVRLDFVFYNSNKYSAEGTIFFLGVWIVTIWVGVANRIEHLRANYLSRTEISGGDDPLARALLSDARSNVTLLTLCYGPALLLLGLIWKLQIGMAY